MFAYREIFFQLTRFKRKSFPKSDKILTLAKFETILRSRNKRKLHVLTMLAVEKTHDKNDFQNQQ